MGSAMAGLMMGDYPAVRNGQSRQLQGRDANRQYLRKGVYCFQREILMALPAIFMLVASRIQEVGIKKIEDRGVFAGTGGQLPVQLVVFPHSRRLFQLAEIGTRQQTAECEIERQYLSNELHFPGKGPFVIVISGNMLQI